MEVVKALKEAEEEVRFTEFAETAGTTPATLKKLSETGVIEIIEREVFRNPSEIFAKGRSTGVLQAHGVPTGCSCANIELYCG